MAEFMGRLHSASTTEQLSVFFGAPYILITLDGLRENLEGDVPASMLHTPSCPVIAITEGDTQAVEDVPDFVDVVVETESDADLVTSSVMNNPIASMVLVRLLRNNSRVNVGDGLFAESLAYSTLQHGAEFQSWLGSRQPQTVEDPVEPPVLVAEENGILVWGSVVERPAAGSNERPQLVCVEECLLVAPLA